MSENSINGATATAVAPEPPPVAAPAEPEAPKPPPPAAKPEPTTETGLETWTVPLAQIDAEGSPFRFRRALKPDAKIKSLAASIETEGLLHPLVVRRVGEHFQLVSGFRRHAALTYLARTKGVDPADFPVKVSVLWEGTTDDEALQVSFAENLARKSLDGTEKAMAVVKLRDEFGKTTTDIQSLMGLKEAQIGRLVDLLAAPDDVREAFRDGKFGLKAAIALARVDDPAVRERFIRKAAVKRLRFDAIGVPDGAPVESVAEGEEPGEQVPEKLRPFVKLAATPNPEYPHRVVVHLKTPEAVDRLLKYLVRFA